jgi:hypothetical protein
LSFLIFEPRIGFKMAKKTVYFGRFISTPTPTELLVRSGAVLVAGEDGSGVIEAVDWEVKNPEEAKSKFGVEDVVTTRTEDGFFFPGFIGMVHFLGACVVLGSYRKGSPVFCSGNVEYGG